MTILPAQPNKVFFDKCLRYGFTVAFGTQKLVTCISGRRGRSASDLIRSWLGFPAAMGGGGDAGREDGRASPYPDRARVSGSPAFSQRLTCWVREVNLTYPTGYVGVREYQFEFIYTTFRVARVGWTASAHGYS